MSDGRCPLYNGIWAAQVPPKVLVFAWRLAQEGLATQSNRKQRTLAEKATCQVCGGKMYKSSVTETCIAGQMAIVG
jgi:hypothetical protein